MARTTAISAQWWPANRKPVLTAIMQASVSIAMLFLCILSWFFGASFDMRYRIHNLKVLVVDFDGGAMGTSLQTAYSEAFTDRQLPTLEFASATKYPDAAAVESAVCHEGYWGAIYTHSGATDRFREAITGKSSATYDSSNTMTYVYSETRYPSTADGYIVSNLVEVIDGSRDFFYDIWNGNSSNVGLSGMNLSDSAAVTAYLDPIKASKVNISPMGQGTHMYLNTVMMVLPVLTQFFFLMAVNGISAGIGLFTNMSPLRIWIMRLTIAKIHAFLMSLVLTGVIWAFREDWDATGLMFGRTWMLFWFYMEISYFVVDSVVGSFIPLPFIAFFVLSWVLMNVASCVFPFELQARFFRVSYLFPAHEVYLLLIQVWTNGCHRKDYIALPVLFAWWVLGHGTTFLSTRKRVADALAVPASPHTAKDVEETTLSEDAGTMSGKASQLTRDADNQTLDQDIEMRAHGSSDGAHR